MVRRIQVEVALKNMQRQHVSVVCSLADVKRANNEKNLIPLKDKEMECKLAEFERAEKSEEKTTIYAGPVVQDAD